MPVRASASADQKNAVSYSARRTLSIIGPAGIGQFQPIMLEFFSMSSTTLETFPNPQPQRDYEIAIRCPEFTSVCPKTGLPDFGEIRITYVPDALCIELKALKYYLVEFRDKGIFYENVTNQILDDLVTACQPRRMTVVGDFSVRGGIKTEVTVRYESPDRS
jgi:7-cyano-7-deazaguanine reductase